ncbi:MarR family transcriptional regulator [Staphylococcus carnosus]|nr:MarR family transcriptional regulator [Staphylococcus carnosus]
MLTYQQRTTLGGVAMSEAINQLITTECQLSQIKHWLKATHQMNMEEFIILYKIHSVEKMSGKELRDTLHYEMKWNTSKIDVLIRKLYKKGLIAKQRSETDERQVFYLLDEEQHDLMSSIVKEIDFNTAA